MKAFAYSKDYAYFYSGDSKEDAGAFGALSDSKTGDFVPEC